MVKIQAQPQMNSLFDVPPAMLRSSTRPLRSICKEAVSANAVPQNLRDSQAGKERKHAGRGSRTPVIGLIAIVSVLVIELIVNRMEIK